MDYHQYYSTSDLIPCKKHPPSSSSSSSSVGICAYCLKDRLVKLVCSDCGEQRLSSCSCSEISPNRNSCTLEVGSVGRVSFLIENDSNNESLIPNTKSKFQEKSEVEDEEFVILRRSSSNSVEVKRNGNGNGNGRFWKIGKLFRKKKEGKTLIGGFDERSENLMVGDYGGGGGGVVSRSRSLCSFRNAGGGGGGGGGGGFGSEDGGDSILSGARSSISGARSSGVNGGLFLESGRRSGFSEAEPRRSGFDGDKRDSFDGGFNRRVFSLRESDFKGMDESRFIDLKLDFTPESKSESQFSSQFLGKMGEGMSMPGFGSTRCGNFVGNNGDGDLSGGGSCRISVNDRGIKRGRKSMKSWRWIFRHNGKKKDEDDLMFKT